MSTDSEGWRQQMEALIGMSPPEPEVEDGGKKDRVPAGAPFTWIAANFAHCPQEANDEVIQTYARVYMWYVISRTIFADGTGKNGPWMSLKALTVFDNKFSWGSAVVPYLYRQLDDACRRSTKDVGVGGSHTQRNTLEDNVDTPEVADEMTLKAFQRSAYMLKPRKEFRRYSPDDYAKGKNPVAGGSRLSRMRSMDDEDDDDDDDELDEPEKFVVVRRKNLASKRGRGPKM
ncbi:Disease resistance protein RPM1 [Hordeum vulgare]|nr:Disease resistance protein RPM1 [Hordeum vulgare]